MNTPRPCGCKGVRTCLQCEREFNIEKPSIQSQLRAGQYESWSYCPGCERLFPGWEAANIVAQHPRHDDALGLSFPGVLVMENFISKDEGVILMENLDSMPWCISQSGRRKQNYGPKTNFKKRKLQNGNFNGFPEGTDFIQERFRSVDLLKDFQTIEQCSLEYDPSKGASIDAHIDDCWVWGERVVTVNCLGDAILTLTLYEDENSRKYNLDLLSEYESRLIEPLLKPNDLKQYKNLVIRIPMPNLSLIVLYGPARYQFQHLVLREDIHERRVCIAYREFTPMFIDGDERDKGDIVRVNARNFFKFNN